MTSIKHSTTHTYLDAADLAELLGQSLRTITLRAKHRPWLLPPRAQLRDQELLRWRQDVVDTWLTNADDLNVCTLDRRHPGLMGVKATRLA